MHSVFNEYFGTFGFLLVTFVLVFTIVAMPLGIYFGMKRGAKIAEEQDRRLHEQHQHHA